MSKASEYAKKIKEAENILPLQFKACMGADVQYPVCQVTYGGQLWFIERPTLNPADALRLRDWITENFE